MLRRESALQVMCSQQKIVDDNTPLYRYYYVAILIGRITGVVWSSDRLSVMNRKQKCIDNQNLCERFPER